MMIEFNRKDIFVFLLRFLSSKYIMTFIIVKLSKKIIKKVNYLKSKGDFIELIKSVVPYLRKKKKV